MERTHRRVNPALGKTWKKCEPVPITHVTAIQKVSTPVTICIPEGSHGAVSPVHNVSRRLISAVEAAWHSLAELFQLFTVPRPWPGAVQLFDCCALYTSSLAVFMNKKITKTRRKLSEFTSCRVKLPQCLFLKLPQTGAI